MCTMCFVSLHHSACRWHEYTEYVINPHSAGVVCMHWLEYLFKDVSMRLCSLKMRWRFQVVIMHVCITWLRKKIQIIMLFLQIYNNHSKIILIRAHILSTSAQTQRILLLHDDIEESNDLFVSHCKHRSTLC